MIPLGMLYIVPYNIQKTTHRPSIRTQHMKDSNDEWRKAPSIKRYVGNGVGYVPKYSVFDIRKLK